MQENIERWRQVAKENVEFSASSVLYENSLKTERKLQKRISSEVFSMAFVIFSAIYSIVIGGHVNTWIVIMGPGEVPTWWPTLLMTNSLLVLIFSCGVMWNFCEEDYFDKTTKTSGHRRERNSKAKSGSVLTQINIFKWHFRMVFASWYYKCCKRLGMKHLFQEIRRGKKSRDSEDRRESNQRAPHQGWEIWLLHSDAQYRSIFHQRLV